MFMPTMREAGTQRVKVPYLSGGINPGSVGEAVADNQLTDCLNVWFKGGEIITRPKLETIESSFSLDFDTFSMQSISTMIQERIVKIYVDRNFNIIILSADTLFVVKKAKSDIAKSVGTTADLIQKQNFIVYSGKAISKNSVGAYLLVSFYVGETNYKKLYEITVIENIWSSGTQIDKIILKEHDLSGDNRNLYIPHVIINGTGNFNANLPRLDDAEYPKPTQLEGFNLLNNSYKCTFTTDSISTHYKLPVIPNGNININIEASNMFIGNSVSFVQTTSNSQIGYSEVAPGFYKETENGEFEKVNNLNFTIEKGNNASNEMYYVDGRCIWYSSDGKIRHERLYYRCKFNCKVDRDTGRLYFPFLQTDFGLYKASNGTVVDNFSKNTMYASKVKVLEGKTNTDESVKIDVSNAYIVIEDTGTITQCIYNDGNYITSFPKLAAWNKPVNFPLPRNGNIYNNMEVIVYNDIVDDDFNKIVNCNVSEYYGGTVGINYGTRSFVSGYDNKIYFSDIDNPLYFPENCYFSVGTPGEIVTAFSKQGGYLVIFKENSIYYTYETQIENNNFAENLTNQTVVDVTARYMYRVFTVNSQIGCDLPNTIQLCMNKLIFANSDGNVYVLNSLSNYSERNIFAVSGLVKDRLLKYNIRDWKAAFSVDYQGHYLLFVGDMGFVLDYNKNSFKYIGSYTSDSNVHKYGLFSWWIWRFPKYLKFGVSTDNHIALVLDDINDGQLELCTLLDSPETKCESYIVSKFFDFGTPDFYKGIERLQVDIGNDYDSTIWLEHLTDGGEVVFAPIEIYKTADKGKPNYLRAKINYPKIELCRKYGFKITAKGGPMAISSVIINYSMKGSVKNGY